MEKVKKERKLSEGFLRNKGRIGEIVRNMTPEQKAKRLATRRRNLAIKKEGIKAITDIKFGMLAELNKGDLHGVSAMVKMMRWLKRVLSTDKTDLNDKDKAELILKLFNFISKDKNMDEKIKQYNFQINNYSDKPVEQIKNVHDIQNWDEKINQLHQSNTQEVDKLVEILAKDNTNETS